MLGKERILQLWIIICAIWLIVGIYGSITNLIPNDIGLGALYIPVLILITLPSGIVVVPICLVLISNIELLVLDQNFHFNALTQVCITWSLSVGINYWFFTRRKASRHQIPTS